MGRRVVNVCVLLSAYVCKNSSKNRLHVSFGKAHNNSKAFL